ncbi:MYC regulator, partial [Polyodon spathula]|nr:transcriptional regulator Myc-B-like [Polyodon spathula]MBN3279808.1 MYC regulator [Polyodon spathula]
MPQSFSPCREWDYEAEPLLFDEEFCQNLMKDLEMIPTPPQSPPTKPGFSESLSSLFPSNLDQLEFVSEMLFEDQDFIHQDFYWGSDLINSSSGTNKNQQPVVSADCLWSSDAGKSAHEKLPSVLSSSPLLSDIDTNIFQDIAATTLDCHSAILDCQQLGTELQDNLEQSSSEYDSSLSTGSVSSSDSEEEEIDVVTIEKWKSSKRRVCTTPCRRSETRFQTRAAIKRCHLEIQLQHNYAAPCPSPTKAEQMHHKRSKRDHAPKHCFSSKGGSSGMAKPSSDMEEEERRRTHNVMERQRRNELKNCFVRLRDNVPELSNNDKASKVVILKKASECIRGLEDEKLKLSSKKDRLRNQQERLRSRLEQLRRGK